MRMISIYTLSAGLVLLQGRAWALKISMSIRPRIRAMSKWDGTRRNVTTGP